MRKLLEVLHGFVDAGNTVIVVEHSLDVIKTADYVIDMGPEGGRGGGRVVVSGTPEEVAACEYSHTGRALLPVLTPRSLPQSQPESAARRGKGTKRRPTSPVVTSAARVTEPPRPA